MLMPQPLVGVIMGSKSDWETMRHADETLTQFGVAARVPCALRAPHAAAGRANTPPKPKRAGWK